MFILKRWWCLAFHKRYTWPFYDTYECLECGLQYQTTIRPKENFYERNNRKGVQIRGVACIAEARGKVFKTPRS